MSRKEHQKQHKTRKKENRKKKNRRKKHSTRIVSIPFQLLKKLGFKQDDVLVAKWKISGDHLELSVKKIATLLTL